MSNMQQNASSDSTSSDMFLQTVAPRFPMAVIAWDDDHIIRFWNQAAEKLFACPAGEATNQHLENFLLKNTNHESGSLPLLNPKTEPSELEFQIINKANKTLHTHWQILDAPDSGSQGYNVAIISDITEQFELNMQAKAAIQSYYELTEHLNDFIYEHDLGGNFIKVNDNGANSIGYTREEFLNLNVRDLVVPAFLSTIQKSIQQKIAGDKTTNHYEIQILDKQGQAIWIEVTNRLIYVDGQPVAVQGIARNINDRKKYEIELKNSENKFRSIFDTIDDIYYHLDTENAFDLVSPSAYTHLGYKQTELLGTRIDDLYTEPTLRKQVLDTLISHGRINDYEIDLQHKNGTVVPFSVSARILLDDNGDPSGIEGIARNIYQRKEHERILKTNEQRFRRIFESIQDVYFRAENTIIKFVSPSCRDMLGYAPEEMIGHRTESFYDDPEARKIMLEKFFAQGTLSDYEINYRHKDGSIVTCSLNLSSIKNSQGEITAFEGTLRDITNRKQSEEALRTSEQRFRRIFESFQDTYYEADMDGKITILSPSVETHYGYKPEELIGKPATVVYANPEQRDGLVAALQKNGVVNDYEIQLVAKSGELRPTSCSTKLVFDETGTPIAVQGVLRDITQRKKSEAALRESEASFRSIFNSIPDAFIEINHFDTIVNASPSLSQFNYTPDKLLGANISTLFENASDWRNIHTLLEGSNEIKGVESVLRRQNAPSVPVSVTAYKIHDDYNPGGNTVCILRDISPRKRYEQELELARDQALEASRAKSSFLANMSHELRTPLNAIIGYSEMLHEDALDDDNKEVADDLEKIHNSGTHLLSLISDILDLSKIEAGKMEIHMEEINLVQLIEEIMVTITPLASQNNNTLSQECLLDSTTIHSDKIRLKQALYNLLSNACKFTSNGKISLEIFQSESDARQWVNFRVTDTGIGITKEQINKLFNEFTQADSTTTREFGGTGLGLVISQRFCQILGGDIEVESEFGKGSVFTIRLPMEKPEELNRTLPSRD